MNKGRTRAEIESATPYVVDTSEDSIHLRCLDSFSLWVLKNDVSLTPSLLKHGYWESWITSWFTHNIHDGDSVVDVGANSGYYTMLFDKLVGPSGSVVAFECNPAYLELLEKTRASNDTDFEIVPFALSDHLGVVELKYPGEYTGSASIMHGFDSKWGETKSISVSCTTLDYSFIERREPNLVKIDAESAEEVIWNGGRSLWHSVNPPVVVLEYSPTGVYTKNFNKELFEYGDVFRIGFDGKEIPTSVRHLNNLTDWEMLVIRKKS